MFSFAKIHHTAQGPCYRLQIMDKNTESVFLAALERGTPDGIVAYAEGACADDRELFERVKRLLAAHENSRGPLECPPTAAGAQADGDASGDLSEAAFSDGR